MRSTLAFAAATLMATGALAKPMQHQQFHQKRQDVVYVTDTEVVYATAVVTDSVTAVANWGHWSFPWNRQSSTTDTADDSATSTLEETSTLAVATSSTPAAVTTTTLATVASSTPAAITTTTLATSTVAKSTSTTVAKSTSTAAATTTQAATQTGELSSYASAALEHHNVHRANHSAPDAVWNTTLVSLAETWAKNCNYSHGGPSAAGGYGQNIAAGAPISNVSAVITDLFYNGEVNYFTQYGVENVDMSNFEYWGHFSQIVWKASTSVGCYTADCSASGLAGVGSDVSPYFTVCNYYPPGNVGGYYDTNIGSPLGEATVDWSYGGITPDTVLTE